MSITRDIFNLIDTDLLKKYNLRLPFDYSLPNMASTVDISDLNNSILFRLYSDTKSNSNKLYFVNTKLNFYISFTSKYNMTKFLHANIQKLIPIAYNLISQIQIEQSNLELELNLLR